MRPVTRIIFDSVGRARFVELTKSANFHRLEDYQTRVPFTSDDLDWFRKPLPKGDY